MDKTKNDILILKEQLEQISNQYADKFKEIDIKEEKWKELEVKSKHIMEQNGNEIIKLNVGGKIFITKVSTLLSSPDTLFSKLLTAGNSSDIFLDRSPKIFAFILEFLRTRKLNVKRLKLKELYDDCLEEANYYGISDMIEKKKILKNINFIKMEVSSLYANSPSSVTVLQDRNLNSAILTNSPGWLLVEFDEETDVEEIEIGGYTGETQWNYELGWGTGGTVSTSLDKNSWVLVGSIPNGFGNKIISFKVKKTDAKYLKLTSTNWLAVGFLNIKLNN